MEKVKIEDLKLTELDVRIVFKLDELVEKYNKLKTQTKRGKINKIEVKGFWKEEMVEVVNKVLNKLDELVEGYNELIKRENENASKTD